MKSDFQGHCELSERPLMKQQEAEGEWLLWIAGAHRQAGQARWNPRFEDLMGVKVEL